MKKLSLAVLACSVLAQGCGKKNVSNAFVEHNHKIVLGAFVDSQNESTLKMSKLVSLPNIVNLESSMTPVKNQWDRGTCSFFTAVSIVEAAIKIDLKKEINLSEEYLNYISKKNGRHANSEGSTAGENLATMFDDGLMLESDSPYQPSWFENNLSCSKFKSSDENAPSVCFSHYGPDDSKKLKIIKSDGLFPLIIKNDTNEVIKFLANDKRPIAVGIMVNENGWPSSGDVTYTKELREECIKTPDVCGGHAIVITGYDLSKKIFFFRNSWGEEWGKKGYGTLPFAYFDLFSSGVFVSMKATQDFVLPKAKAEKEIKLSNFNINSKLKADHSLSIKLSGVLENINGRFINATSYLVKEDKDAPKTLNDQKYNFVFNNKIKIPVRTVKNFSPELLNANIPYVSSHKAFTFPFLEDYYKNLLVWEKENPLDLSIASSTMELPEVTDLLNSSSEKVVLRTSVYSFGDTGYRQITRVYHPLNYTTPLVK